MFCIKVLRRLKPFFICVSIVAYLKGHILRLNDEIIRRVRPLKIILIDPARSGAHLAASSRRTRTDRIVEAFWSWAHSDGANNARLAAPSATKICRSHATVIAHSTVAVPSRFTKRLQPQLKVGQTCLPRLTTFHFQIGDPFIEITDITLRCDTANPAHVRYSYERHVRHAFGVQSSFQTISRRWCWHLQLLLRFHTADLCTVDSVF